jgi:hypothetical protein
MLIPMNMQKNKGKAARVKGHSFERAIANAFRLAGWLGAKRHLEVQVQDCLGFDIDGVEPFRIQCKNHKDYVSINTIKEIKPSPGSVPMLITKADSGPPVCVLYFSDLMRLITEAKAKGVNFSSPTVNDF